ncbi:DUF6009 family protein [Nostoc sp.]|uniref:DUF6009 family protein n=1 Tax=Nostoc sp. TaxID=1180 RepID=UPI002FF80417
MITSRGHLRRVFFLCPKDRYFDLKGTYKHGIPAKTIDPLTISPGVLGIVTDKALG